MLTSPLTGEALTSIEDAVFSTETLGKGFEPQVKEGGRVKKGQLLLKFDIDYIKSQGLPVTTPVVVSNTDGCADVTALVTGKVDLNTQILQVKA